MIRARLIAPLDASMDPLRTLSRSRALWNREHLDLRSNEILAQILDRGSLEDWQALYQLLAEGGEAALALRERTWKLLLSVPTARPHFWRSALASLGYPVDWGVELKTDPGDADI